MAWGSKLRGRVPIQPVVGGTQAQGPSAALQVAQEQEAAVRSMAWAGTWACLVLDGGQVTTPVLPPEEEVERTQDEPWASPVSPASEWLRSPKLGRCPLAGAER